MMSIHDKYEKVFNLVHKEVNYGRSAVMFIHNGIIKFDTSDGEYGEGKISIEELESKIKEYKRLNGKN